MCLQTVGIQIHRFLAVQTFQILELGFVGKFCKYLIGVQARTESLAFLAAVLREQNAFLNTRLLQRGNQTLVLPLPMLGQQDLPDISSGNDKIVNAVVVISLAGNGYSPLSQQLTFGKRDLGAADLHVNAESGDILEIADELKPVLLVLRPQDRFGKSLVGVIQRMGDELHESLLVDYLGLDADKLRVIIGKDTVFVDDGGLDTLKLFQRTRVLEQRAETGRKTKRDEPGHGKRSLD